MVPNNKIIMKFDFFILNFNYKIQRRFRLRGNDRNLQNPLQNLREHLWISLSCTGFHALSDEESEEVLFPGFVLRNLRGIVGKDLLGDDFESSGIAHLSQAKSINDLIYIKSILVWVWKIRISS